MSQIAVLPVEAEISKKQVRRVWSRRNQPIDRREIFASEMPSVKAETWGPPNSGTELLKKLIAYRAKQIKKAANREARPAFQAAASFC